MSTTISLREAQRDLPRYVQAAASGEEIVVEEAGQPSVKLVLVPPSDIPQRRLGSLEGLGWESPDAWSSESDEEIAELLQGAG